jgi:hypothetical protein
VGSGSFRRTTQVVAVEEGARLYKYLGRAGEDLVVPFTLNSIQSDVQEENYQESCRATTENAIAETRSGRPS